MGPPTGKRAYRACQTCREGKAKCIITDQDKANNRPCTRCRRQRRRCIFTTPGDTDGHSPKRQRRDPVRQRRDTVEYATTFKSTPVSQISADLAIPTSPVKHYFGGQDYLSDTSATGRRNYQIPSDSPKPTPESSMSSLMNTIVSKDGDALSLLFRAASQDSNRTQQPTPEPTSARSTDSSSKTRETIDPREAWSRSECVRKGWISAEEAVNLVDLFFHNMAPFTPIIDDRFSKQENHNELVTTESFLSCVILTISSRYHALPGPNGLSRGYIIHERLWSRCQQLLNGILLGQVDRSLRTLGSIQALVLLTEWQPRGLHVDLIDTVMEERTARKSGPDDIWVNDSMWSAKKYDNMSWMMIGVAVSLAHELGVFNRANSKRSKSPWRDDEQQEIGRQVALANLLYTYQCHLATRLGRESTAVQGIGDWPKLSNLKGCGHTKRGEDWCEFMAAWTELEMITRSIRDVLFPSTHLTGDILGSGRYVSIIDNFQSLLAKWEQDHIKATDKPTLFQTLLNFDYQSAKISANSLGLQAAVERHSKLSERYPFDSIFALNATEHRFVQPLVDGCLEILEMAIGLAERGTLRFAPVRVFLRTTIASVFLLKYLGLKIGTEKTKIYLDVLVRVIEALKRSTPDDLHLGSRYAALLEMYVLRVQENIAATPRSSNLNTRPTTPEADHAGFLEMLPEPGNFEEGWFGLDPSLGSLLPEDNEGSPGPAHNSLGLLL